MSEEQGAYLVGDKRKTELQFYAKRLVDFTKHIESLTEEERNT